MTVQANAEPDLAQTGKRLRPVMASLVQGILNLVLPSVLAGDSLLQVDNAVSQMLRSCSDVHAMAAGVA